MLCLSAERINTKAPYKVSNIDDCSVTFSTADGIGYDVGFTKDIFIFDEGAYFCFISNHPTPSHSDIKIFQTIAAVFEDFLTDI